MKLTILLAMTAALGLAPVTYYATRPAADPLGETLQDYGFRPIHPPSNLLQVGSLYLVDPVAGTFTTICDADRSDLEDGVKISPSWEIKSELERKGRFSVSVQATQLFEGDAGQDYVVKVQSSLTDVELREIALGANLAVLQKLMAKPACAEVAMQYIDAHAYVCQGQKILTATARYRLERDTEGKLSTHVAADDIASSVKAAVQAGGSQSLEGREGQWFSGSALQYGISMNPQCMTPKHARYQRILPQSAVERMWNAFLFSVVEPMLPPTSDSDESEPRVAHG